MPFVVVAEYVGDGADTKSVGIAFDALSASGLITPKMIAAGEALYCSAETSQKAARKSAHLFAEAKRISRATGLSEHKALSELRAAI